MKNNIWIKTRDEGTNETVLMGVYHGCKRRRKSVDSSGGRKENQMHQNRKTLGVAGRNRRFRNTKVAIDFGRHCGRSEALFIVSLFLSLN